MAGALSVAVVAVFEIEIWARPKQMEFLPLNLLFQDDHHDRQRSRPEVLKTSRMIPGGSSICLIA